MFCDCYSFFIIKNNFTLSTIEKIEHWILNDPNCFEHQFPITTTTPKTLFWTHGLEEEYNYGTCSTKMKIYYNHYFLQMIKYNQKLSNNYFILFYGLGLNIFNNLYV
jgi:hypothetical protein